MSEHAPEVDRLTLTVNGKRTEFVRVDKADQLPHLLDERAAAVAELRSLCEVFGDNDWPDSLNLADVIGKHLARALHRRLMNQGFNDD